MPPTPSRSSPKASKPRHTKACKRCTRRKQRCYGFPVCRACDEAKVPCEPSAYAIQLYAESSGGMASSGSVGGYAAQQRIQALEIQLAGALAELAVVRQQQCTQNSFVLNDRTSTEPMSLLFADTDDASSLIGGHNNQVSHDSQADIPGTVEQMVQSTVWSKGLLSVGDGAPPLSPMSPLTSFSVPHPPPPPPPLQSMPAAQLPETQLPPLSSSRPPPLSSPPSLPQPSDAMGRRMIEIYFAKIHPRYPFLDRAALLALHEQAQRQDMTPQPPSTMSLAERFCVFRLNMVYAIGGTLLKITDPLCEAQAETYLAVALRDVAVVQDAQVHSHSHPPSPSGHAHGHKNTLLAIEGLVLLVIYNLRAVTNTGIWYLTNLAMQTCIDLRLHLEASYHDATLSEQEKHIMRRLFWSTYVLDRFIALSFKRPFSIAEGDIETELPDGQLDGCMWRRFIEIKRLESRIQTDVYGVSESLPSRRKKIAPLLAEVDAWGRSIPDASTGEMTLSETVYLELQWNEAVTQLLRPFLSTLDCDDPLLIRCLHAAGNICALFREMYVRDAYGHSFVSAHVTFITGVTICYCLFRASSTHSLARLLDARVASHLRACSCAMFIISERHHRLRKHRDILEDIIGRIMEARLRPGSNGSTNTGISIGTVPGSGASTIIGPGTVPASVRHDLSAASTQISQLDFAAVQSLLDLAAQQEPRTCTSPAAGANTNTSVEPSSMMADASGVRSHPPIYNAAGLPSVLDFNAPESWDVDCYSLEMLGRMIAPR